MDWKDDPVGPSRLVAMIVEESDTPRQMVKRSPVAVYNVSGHERPPHQRSHFNRCHAKHVLAGMFPHLNTCLNPVLLLGKRLDDVVGKDLEMPLCPFPFLPPSVTRNAQERDFSRNVLPAS